MATVLPSHRKLNLPRMNGEPRSQQHPLSPHTVPNKHVSNENSDEQDLNDILPHSHPLSPHTTGPGDDQSQCINEANTNAHAPTTTQVENVASHPLSPHGISLDQDHDQDQSSQFDHVASTQATFPSVSSRKMYTPSTSSTTTPADLTHPATSSMTTNNTNEKPSRTILLINGPNLNLLGHREPQIYGHAKLQDIITNLATMAEGHGIQLQHYQSNHEGQILDRIHACLTGIPAKPLTSNEIYHMETSMAVTSGDSTIIKPDAIIINPGALTHTSIALRDALLGVSIPFIEVHISNVHTRESFRHHSYLSDKATAVIAGLGIFGYEAALRYWIEQWTLNAESK